MANQEAQAFSLDLLQAISDWQHGGDEAMKRKRGKKLKTLSANVDERFRQVGGPCYRRVALDKFYVSEMGEKLKVKETISAWTSSLGVAKTFKDGVPPGGWQGVIFETRPHPDEIVLNLAKLYGNVGFRAACDDQKHRIKGFSSGIGEYADSQKEVILEMDEIAIGSVHLLGGYSSDLLTIARKMLRRQPSQADLEKIGELLKAGGLKLGPRWLGGSGKDRIVEFWKAKAKQLKPFRVPSRSG